MRKSTIVTAIILMMLIGLFLTMFMSCTNEIPVYTVHFDSQGGSAVSAIEALKGTRIVEPPSPVKNGYEFSGWFKDTGLTSVWNFNSDTLASDITLYAKWSATTYLVTYNGNGNDKGTVPLTQEKTHGIDLELAANSGDLQRTGYSFAGWNSEVDGSGTDYAEGSTYTTDVALTLYAKWTASKYSVTYHANGATSGTVPDVQTKTRGVSFTVSANTGNLVRTGYSFTGWNSRADGLGSDYAIGDTYTPDFELRLFAKWTPNRFSVSYDINGATEGSAPSDLNVYILGSMAEVKSSEGLVNDGYKFFAWNTEADGSGDFYFEDQIAIIYTDLHLFAIWLENDIATKYNVSGGVQ